MSEFRVDFVAKPKLGYEDPAEVRAEVEFNLNRVAHHIREEWDQLREHDVVFLIHVVEGIAPKKPHHNGAGAGRGHSKGASPGSGSPRSLCEPWHDVSVRGIG